MISKKIQNFINTILGKREDNSKELIEIIESIYCLNEIDRKLFLKSEDLYLEEKITILVRPFLLLDQSNFNFFINYKNKINNDILPYYFDFQSENDSEWEIHRKVSFGVGNTAIEFELRRIYEYTHFLIKEKKDSFGSISLNQNHMEDEDVYSNMKSFLEDAITHFESFIVLINDDPEISKELKDLASLPVEFSKEVLEKRALKHEIETIKKILPDEIKSKNRFDLLQQKLPNKTQETKRNKI